MTFICPAVGASQAGRFAGSADPAGTSSGSTAQSFGPASPLPSTALLQGRTVVQIEHNGALYQLRSTRLGKLILTK